jgi:hypothetical protein
VPGRRVASLANIALASGYTGAYRFSSQRELDHGLDEALRSIGPTFISLTITGPGTVGSPVAVPNKAIQIDNMRLALGAR